MIKARGEERGDLVFCIGPSIDMRKTDGDGGEDIKEAERFLVRVHPGYAGPDLVGGDDGINWVNSIDVFWQKFIEEVRINRSSRERMASTCPTRRDTRGRRGDVREERGGGGGAHHRRERWWLDVGPTCLNDGPARCCSLSTPF